MCNCVFYLKKHINQSLIKLKETNLKKYTYILVCQICHSNYKITLTKNEINLINVNCKFNNRDLVQNFNREK